MFIGAFSSDGYIYRFFIILKILQKVLVYMKPVIDKLESRRGCGLQSLRKNRRLDGIASVQKYVEAKPRKFLFLIS